MEMTKITNKGYTQWRFDNVSGYQIKWPNFAGAPDKFNKNGSDKGYFTLAIDSTEISDVLVEEGFPVKITARDDGEDPYMNLKITVNFNGRYPLNIHWIAGKKRQVINNQEDAISLDRMDIESASFVINRYEWTNNGNSGISAYLDSMKVYQHLDPFEAEFMDEEADEDVPF